MVSWDNLTDKVAQALGDIPVPTLFGQPIGNITPEMAAKVAVAVIKEDVDAHIASIPRVPTNGYDAAITIGGMALFGGIVAGLGYFLYKMDRLEGNLYAPSPKAPESKPAEEQK